jgi:anti-sigma B factor antagonist
VSGTQEDAHLTIERDDAGVLRVAGDIDMAGGPVLDASIRSFEGKGPLILDLAGVTFIDSSGLRTMLGAARRAETRGERVRLTSVGREVARLLEITCTNELFEIASAT